MDRDARSDARQRMRVDARFPQELPARGVDRVRVAADVAKERRHLIRPSLEGPDHRRAAQSRLSLERPVHAPCGGVERIEISRIGADEDPAIHNRRLSVRRRGPRQSKRPFQLQPRDRGCGKPMASQRVGRSRLSRSKTSGNFCRLEAVVPRHVRAPSIPGRRRQVRHGRMRLADVRHGAGRTACRRAQPSSADPLRDRHSLIVRQLGCVGVGAHAAGRHRLVKLFRCQLLEHLRRHRLLDVLLAVTRSGRHCRNLSRRLPPRICLQTHAVAWETLAAVARAQVPTE